MKAVVVISFLAVLAGCAEVREASDNVARAGARAAVDEVLVTRFPNVDGSRVTPYTDCVIDEASSRELSSLARSALVGVDEATVSLVFDIAQRPATATCLLQASLAPTT